MRRAAVELWWEVELRALHGSPAGRWSRAAGFAPRKRSLARAGRRIVDVDPRYVQIEVDRASGDENHRLRVVRREDAADELAADVVD